MDESMDGQMDIAGFGEDAETASISATTESIPEEEVPSEPEEVEEEGSAESEEIGENTESAGADSESSLGESESNAIADTPFRADSVDGYVSYVSVPSGYEVVSVSNIPDYTNFFIVLIFALGSLMGFAFARIASWR